MTDLQIANANLMAFEARRKAAKQESKDSRFVSQWMESFHYHRNAACEGQKNFRGV